MRFVSSKWLRLIAASWVCACLLAACSEGANEGDCSARIRLGETVFRSRNELNQAAPAGGALGSGEVIGCGSASDADTVDTVTVYEVAGVDSQTAVVIKDQDWSGVYVAEGTPRSEWPAPLESGD
ncbi:hypothetical protein BH09ACT10_BH09ACT10_22820 [soil metagenome]